MTLCCTLHWGLLDTWHLHLGCSGEITLQEDLDRKLQLHKTYCISAYTPQSTASSHSSHIFPRDTIDCALPKKHIITSRRLCILLLLLILEQLDQWAIQKPYMAALCHQKFKPFTDINTNEAQNTRINNYTVRSCQRFDLLRFYDSSCGSFRYYILVTRRREPVSKPHITEIATD